MNAFSLFRSSRRPLAVRVTSLIALTLTVLASLQAEQTLAVPNMFATMAGANQGFDAPSGVAVDLARNVYVSDTNNHTIRKITPSGMVSTIAGQVGIAGSFDGTGATATFNQPAGVALDTAGNLYVADSLNHAVRKITPSGDVSTLASGFNHPQAVTVDATGSVYVADSGNHAVRKISSTGVVSTLNDSFQQPVAVAVEASGNVFVADAAARTISKISLTGEISVIAGGFNRLTGVAIDEGGNVYVTDAGAHTLRKISTNGVIATVAGVTAQAGAIDGATGVALFNQPTGIAISAWGDVYVADRGNNLIREGYVFFPVPEITELSATQQVVAPGQGFVLSIAAAGIGPLSYQWYHEGRPIAGANQSSIRENAITPAMKGAYSVAVTDDLGRNEKSFYIGVASTVTQVQTEQSKQTF